MSRLQIVDDSVCRERTSFWSSPKGGGIVTSINPQIPEIRSIERFRRRYKAQQKIKQTNDKCASQGEMIINETTEIQMTMQAA